MKSECDIAVKQFKDRCIAVLEELANSFEHQYCETHDTDYDMARGVEQAIEAIKDMNLEEC